MSKYHWLLAAMLVSPLATGAAAAQPADGSVDAPAPDDIERTIATLEDPDARATLIADLKVLLQHERGAEEANADRPVDLLDTLHELVTGAWNALTSVDPRQVVISSMVSSGIVLVTLTLRLLLFRLLRRFYRRLAESHEQSASGSGPDEESGARIPPTVARLINLVLAVLAVALIAESWGAGLGELLQTDLGARIAQAALSIAVILVVTVVLWNVSGLVVTRALTLAAASDDQERMGRRLDTLVPLLRSVAQLTIGVLSGLLILSELGVNIGPLLAGAGILGLAVGFGAQTLVKDLLTGITLLLEDGATVGDVVETAGHSGVVEEMRIRTMHLRDLSGHVHLIPYSEVATIVNMTKDFSYYLMDIGVAYRENTDEVFEVIGEVCERMREENEWRTEITAPLEILGVNRFADSAVEIRARIRTRPGSQWAVGREFNRRMKHAFDDRGIEIPFPHTTLYFGEPKEGRAPPANLLLAEGSERAG